MKTEMNEMFRDRKDLRFFIWYLYEKQDLPNWVSSLPNVPLKILHGYKFTVPGSTAWLQDYHPGGDKEIRSNVATAQGAGQQAVYDKKGDLITEAPGAGTADRRFDLIAHLNEDVAPYELALRLDGINLGGKKLGPLR